MSWLRTNTVAKDQVLDTPKIRRTPWSDLAMMSTRDLVIDQESQSSEAMQTHAGFEKLDLEGYTSHFARGRKWIRSIPVDRLIKIYNKIGTISRRPTGSNTRGSGIGMRSRGSATRCRGSIRHGRELVTHDQASERRHGSLGGW